MRVFALVALGTVAGCFATPGAGAGFGGDDLASRCKMGFDMFERSRCGAAQRGAVAEIARAELESFRAQCKDPGSQARIASLEQSCITKYASAQRADHEDRRNVRAKYVSQVSELLLDPEYPPLADRYKDLEERAFNRDAAAKAELPSVRAQLAALADKHGIPSGLAKELQLW